MDSSSHSSLRKRREDREQPDENNASAGIEEIRSRPVQTILSIKELNSGAHESQTGQEDGARSSDNTKEATPDLKESEETKAECPNKSKGCQWTGLTKEELEQHLNKTSGNNEEDSTGETDGCDYRTVQCPECKQNVVLKAMATHQEEALSHQVVPCELKYAGCDFECPQYQMPAHKEAEMAKHLDLLHTFFKQERDTFFKQERDELVLKNVTLWRHMKMVAAILFLVIVVAALFQHVKLNNLMELHLRNSLKMNYFDDVAHKLDQSVQDTELQLSSQDRLVKDLSVRLDLLDHDVNKDLEPDLKDAKQDIVQIQETLRDLNVRLDLLHRDIKKDLEPNLKDAKQDIVQIQETLRGVKVTINGITSDVKELKTGFSKKYIDDTVRKLRCAILPKYLSNC